MASSLRSRVKAAARALLGQTEYINTMVRPSDVSSGQWPRYKNKNLESLKLNSGWVKCAAGRNAAAVASFPIMVMRDAARGKTGFETRRLGGVEAKHARRSAGRIATKAAIKAGENIEEITDPNHPLVRLLDTPNPFCGGYELRELGEMMQGLCGDFGWFIVRGANGWPIEAWPMFPQFTEVVPSEDKLIRAFTYGRSEEIRHTFDPSQVVFFKRPNPFGDPYRGVGDLYACAVAAELSLQFDSFAYNTLENATQPGLIIAAKNFPKPKRDAAYAEMRNRNGVRNAARDMFLELDTKDALIQTWEPKAHEAGFLGGASDEATMKKIAACFDIPHDILMMSSTSKAHGETAHPHWMQYGVLPRLNREEDTLNRSLVPMFAEALNDPGLFVMTKSPLSEDMDAITVRENTQLLNGWGTVNEARAAVGKPPMDDGDELRDPMAGLGVTGAGAVNDENDEEPAKLDTTDDGVGAAASGEVQATALNGAQVQALSDLATQCADGKLPVESAVAIATAAFPLVSPETIAAIFNPVRNFTPRPDPEPPTPPISPGGGADRNLPAPSADSVKGIAAPCCQHAGSFIKSLLARRDIATKEALPPPSAQEDKMRRALSDAFKFAAPWIIDAMLADPSIVTDPTLTAIEGAVKSSELGPTVAQAVGDEAMPLFTDGWDTALDGPNKPPAMTITGPAGQTVTMPTPSITMDWESPNEFAREAMQDYRIKLAQSVEKTTAEALRTVIEEGVANGKTVPQLTDDVRGVMGHLSDYAAERIARTESQRAYHSGRLAAWQETGIVKGWKFILSGNPCEMCREAERQFTDVPLGSPMIPLGGSFSWMEDGVKRTTVNNYQTMMAPPLHPNCACDMVAIWNF